MLNTLIEVARYRPDEDLVSFKRVLRLNLATFGFDDFGV